jgi:acetolactate synthase-1/2/3 large subunit
MTAPGQIATLILPSDTAWNTGGVPAEPIAPPSPKSVQRLDEAVAALSGADSLLLLGGTALTRENLELAGKISAGTGCALLSEWSNARLERGAGIVAVGRVPYPIDQALSVLAPFKRIVLVGARAPIGFFAYPGKPAILTADGAKIIEVAGAGADLDAALAALCTAVGADDTAPAHVATAHVPGPADGRLTPDTIATVLARTIPENAIVVDESVTTGRSFFPTTKGLAPHTWLNNCGGSIGYGMPVAIGAAIACPDRKVLGLIGDGSAMYTLQALWTMAREGLDITVVIFSNRSYRILRGELTNVGVGNPGPRAIDMLSLDRPDLNWAQMANGMGVEASAVHSAQELEEAIQSGLASTGPCLIEAVM